MAKKHSSFIADVELGEESGGYFYIKKHLMLYRQCYTT